jgi:hypothetical protein
VSVGSKEKRSRTNKIFDELSKLATKNTHLELPGLSLKMTESVSYGTKRNNEIFKTNLAVQVELKEKKC